MQVLNTTEHDPTFVTPLHARHQLGEGMPVTGCVQQHIYVYIYIYSYGWCVERGVRKSIRTKLGKNVKLYYIDYCIAIISIRVAAQNR